MKVLIAGGGIGGLTAALCLAKSGHEVTVFERASAVTEVGAGLQCGANVVKVFDYLGLSEKVAQVSVRPERVEFRDFQSGRSFHSMELGEQYAAKYGAPYYHVYRTDLLSILLDSFREYDAGHIELDSPVVSYEEGAHEVTLRTKGGRELVGDCLIGADGIKSVIREQSIGAIEPVFSGNVAWRGVVDTQRLPVGWMDKIASNFVGPNKHMVLYYLRDQKLANMVGVVANSDWQSDSWMSRAPWSELKSDFDGWHGCVQDVIDAMDKDQCFKWALKHYEPLDTWGTGRVSLLGDAAHSTLPFMASGAAMAIEDGRVLQRSLDQAGDVAEGLQLYQRNRMARTAKIQSNSARLGNIYHIKNRFLQRAAFAGIGIFGKRQEAYLPSYDANTVELV